MAECLLVFCFLTSGFSQKWYIPQGQGMVPTKTEIADTDRDDKTEIIFTTYGSWPAYLHFYEFHSSNSWLTDSVPLSGGNLLWCSGDFDNDGLYNLVLQFHIENPSLAVGIMIFESPDSFSYPTQEVWRDTVGQGLVVPICVYDIDMDGVPEVVKVLGNYIHLHIYESVGNNLYDKIAEITTAVPYNSSSTLAFGDFDLDNKNEFVFGYSAGQYSIFECIGNNSYQEITSQQLPTANVKDCFTVPDMDGDGKLEFVVKGFVIPDARTDCFIFEATGNNTYQIIKSFHLPNSQDWDYGGGYSDVGDVDGDSIPEIALESASYVYLIKSAGNDSFYVWQTLPGNSLGTSIRITNDLDNNGLNEIVISGGNQTRIYEKTPEVTWFCPVQYDTFWANDTVYPRWKLDETIGLDSLRLYWAHPQFGCQLIYQGLATDTLCSWVVPDTQSNMSNRLWLVVEGNGRYDSTYSPVFYIKRAQGIEEGERFKVEGEGVKLEVYPNPFTNHCVIKFQIPNSNLSTLYSATQIDRLLATLNIYDVSGRLVKSFNHLTIQPFNQIVWSGDDESGRPLPNGIYFIRLESGKIRTLEKAVLLR